jgi:hypothetical protein
MRRLRTECENGIQVLPRISVRENQTISNGGAWGREMQRPTWFERWRDRNVCIHPFVHITERERERERERNVKQNLYKLENKKLKGKRMNESWRGREREGDLPRRTPD